MDIFWKIWNGIACVGIIGIISILITGLIHNGRITLKDFIVTFLSIILILLTAFLYTHLL